MIFIPTKPFDELPHLPPKGEIETKRVLKACNEANKELARLNAEVKQLPNPALLLPSISLLEAKASSEIENIVTTNDQLFRGAYIENEPTDAPTKEAIRYQRAIWDGFRKLAERPICTNTAIEICSTIKDSDIGIRRVPGTTISNKNSNTVIYTPPVGEELIRTMLANWENYLHEPSDIDPLIRMAVQHYQFEAIHPFSDGNGRTGRVLNILFLVEQKVLELPILYLSREVLEYRATYYALLADVTLDQAWEDWIAFILELIALSAVRTTRKLAELHCLTLAAKSHILQALPRVPSGALLDVIFSRPYCRITDLVNVGVAKRETASEYLRALVRIGVLEAVTVGREKIFINQRLRLLLADRTAEVMDYSANALAPPKPMFPTPPTSQTS